MSRDLAVELGAAVARQEPEAVADLMDELTVLTVSEQTRVIFELYRHRHYRLAFSGARRLSLAGDATPVILGIVAHLGGLFDAAGEAMAATARLDERLAALPTDQASVRSTVGARVREEVVQAAAAQDYRRIQALGALARRLFPELEPGQVESRPLAPGTIPERPRRLSPLPLLAERAPRPVIVAYCERTHPANPNSRRHEIGPLMVAAMARYGWQPVFYGLRTVDDPALLAADWSALLALCHRHRPDVVMIQELRPDAVPDGLMAAFVAAVRRAVVGVKVVGVYGDPWDRDRWDALVEAAGHLDRLWAPFPSLALWHHPALRDKVMTPPFPHEGLGGFSAPALVRGGGRRSLTLSFVGGVDSANWGRALWLADLKQAGVPIRISVTRRITDGLPALESYRGYLKTLAATGCALSFSLRADGSRITTGRAFEAILAGALLVQESCADIESYFTPGEHFLSFTTRAELIEIARQLAEQPQPLLEIRNRAFDFYQEHYRDECVIGHLEHRLFQDGASL